MPHLRSALQDGRENETVTCPTFLSIALPTQSCLKPSVFTEEELQGLIDFYQSPVGQKFLEKQPELMQATMQKMQGEMAKIMPQIQADIQAAIQKAQSSE